MKTFKHITNRKRKREFDIVFYFLTGSVEFLTFKDGRIKTTTTIRDLDQLRKLVKENERL